MRRHPAVAFILPFVVFIGLLGIQQIIAVPAWVRFFVSIAAILAFSLGPLRGAPGKPILSILVGIVVFGIWVGPDLLAPGWHHSILFSNSVMGHPAGNTPPASKSDPAFLFFRVALTMLAVPVLEELFWRGWLMRWLIDSHHFERVPRRPADKRILSPGATGLRVKGTRR